MNDARRIPRPADAKLVRLADLPGRLEPLRDQGLRIALANGLFDIIHVGHLSYLEAARAEADVLVVAINSDRSARALKGPTRPVVPEHERALLVAGFDCVDLVTVFEESDVENVLRTCRPHVHCKGTDYTADSVPEAAVARELGTRVAIVGNAKMHSTRDIISRLRSG